MGWPLDPRSWWSDAESTPVAQWLDRWSESTRWWLDPARASPSAQGVLFDLVEGISGRFRGRRVTLDRLRQSVVLTLDDVTILRRSGAHDVELRASDVDWVGVPVRTASVYASDVAVELGATSTFVARTIDIEGEADAASVAAWLGSMLRDEWHLAPRADGLVDARRPGGTVVYTVLAHARDGAVSTELRELRWRDLRIALPHWLRLDRTRSLPRFGRGIEVLSAAVEGSAVQFRLRLGEVREPIELDGIRDAILGGLTRLPWPWRVGAPTVRLDARRAALDDTQGF